MSAEAGDPASAAAARAAPAARRSAFVRDARQAGEVVGDRADADHRAHPVADAVEEVVGDPVRALLAVRPRRR